MNITKARLTACLADFSSVQLQCGTRQLRAQPCHIVGNPAPAVGCGWWFMQQHYQQLQHQQW
jgi:hypothetical protein